LPVINRLIPGSGITPLNVRELTLDWWMLYVHLAKAILDARKSNNRRS